MRRVLRLYDKRLINVNVNILAAGAVALTVTVLFIALAQRTGLLDHLTGWVARRRIRLPFGVDIHAENLVISGLTFLVDLVADVLAYYGLHWLANHMPRRTHRAKPAAFADMSFMRDASLVQFERAILSPVLYVLALGLQNVLLHRGMGVEAATAWGFGLGMIATRALHTLWMIRAERRARGTSAVPAESGHEPRA